MKLSKNSIKKISKIVLKKINILMSTLHPLLIKIGHYLYKIQYKQQKVSETKQILHS